MSVDRGYHRATGQLAGNRSRRRVDADHSCQVRTHCSETGPSYDCRYQLMRLRSSCMRASWRSNSDG